MLPIVIYFGDFFYVLESINQFLPVLFSLLMTLHHSLFHIGKDDDINPEDAVSTNRGRPLWPHKPSK